MKRKSNYTARKTWVDHFGPVPKDSDGFSYEVHHKDGNSSNNDISNLELLPITEHLNIHLQQKDWAAAALISKRLGLGPEFASSIQLGKKRPGVGGAPKGRPPWNKGMKDCFSEEVVARFRQVRAGRRFGRLKLTDKECRHIIDLYNSKINVPGAGEKSKNGRIQTYETAFSKHIHQQYNVTPRQIYNIVTGRRNVRGS